MAFHEYIRDAKLYSPAIVLEPIATCKGVFLPGTIVRIISGQNEDTDTYRIQDESTGQTASCVSRFKLGKLPK